MMMPHPALESARAFCQDYEIQIPVLMAPMAGACPASLAIAVANAGGMGACGTLLMQPDAIAAWASEVRANTNGGFQLNLWIPDPEPERHADAEADVRAFLGQWGPEVAADAGDAGPLDFEAQCQAMLNAGPPVISSIMGIYPEAFVAQMKERNIKWWATATTVAEAREAVAAGADVVVAQGMEAGGHRGAFDAGKAGIDLVGLFSLLPAIVDAVDVPVVATGGIGDARGAAAAFVLGASAVQVGTGLLRSPEASLPSAWADAIGQATPEGTIATRAFSGRLGRSIKTAYVEAANSENTPEPAPYPVQRGLTGAMRGQASKDNDIDRMQAWAGQSAGLSEALPATEIVTAMWDGVVRILERD
ncbi:MAG: nitronate monooxygenase [Pseudomonadota bacterium]